MNCLKCGAQNVDGALFCTKCGSPLESTQSATVIDAPTSSESASAPQPISSASPYAQGTSSGGYSSSTYSSPGPLGVESNKDWMGIVSLVCGIASLPCCFTCFGGLIVGAVAIVFGILGINTRN
ncbi:MAG: zinc-ribbon domain-containing protein, partial [Oscillospiraceae bacterium]